MQAVSTELVLFYYTLVAMLAIMIAGAFCLAAFLVSKKRALAFLAGSFMSYFFDMALVFRDDYLMRNADGHETANAYFIGAPLPSVVTGAGVFGCLWLAVCSYFDEKNAALKGVPILFYALGCLAVYALVPEGRLHMLLFYGMRFLFVAWIVGFMVMRSLKPLTHGSDPRMKRIVSAALILGLFDLATLAENVVVLLVLGGQAGDASAVPFFPERNFAENAMMITIAACSCYKAASLLELRSNAAPVYSSLHGCTESKETIESYAHRFSLTERECEVLEQILQGKDNQNIASSLNVTPGTVKVHVHNLLKKTGKSNRKELIKDFWMRS